MSRAKAPPALLLPREVAALFRVDVKTVTRWAQTGKLRCIRTLGGHRRYRRADIEAFLRRGNAAIRGAPPARLPE